VICCLRKGNQQCRSAAIRALKI